jgi:hypothetical protein
MPGAMLQQSLLPSWFFKALALAAVGAVALVALWFLVFRPAVESTARAVAEDQTKELADSIREASEQAAQAENQSEQAEQKAEVANENSKEAEKTATKNDERLDETIGPGGPGIQQGGPSAPASGTMDAQEARDFRVPMRVAPRQGFEDSDPVEPPGKRVLWVSDLVLQNPDGDSGTLRVQRDDDVLMVFALENFRDLDYHFIQPAKFTAEDPIVVSVRCTNETGACTPSVYFSGQVLAPEKKQPATKPAKKNA